MGIAAAGLVPHPPLLIPEIGGRDLVKVDSTRRAMEKMAKFIEKAGVAAVLTISPHGPVFSDAVSIMRFASLGGSFAQFGVADVTMSVPIELGLVDAIAERCRREQFPLKILDGKETRKYNVQPVLDHGVLVPLYYLHRRGLDLPLVPLNMGLLSYSSLYRFGKLVQEVLLAYPQDVMVLASGDLSHRLIPSAPAGFSPRGKEFDQKLLEILEAGTYSKLLRLDPALVEKAGECGLRPLIILAGIIEDLDFKCDILSYEGPFGVGYAVAFMEKEKGDGDSRFPVMLARTAVETYIEKGISIDPPPGLPAFLEVPGAAFVSIKTERGELRGCIGTLTPTQDRLAREIIANAVEAATSDPRFPPVKKEELPNLKFSVDILEEPERVSSPAAQLDPKRYGVIVQCGHRKGVLLPNLPGIESVEEQLAVAHLKAGIKPEEDVVLKRFRVRRFIQK